MVGYEYLDEEIDEIKDELSNEYTEIEGDLDAIERDVLVLVLAGALGVFWYLLND